MDSSGSLREDYGKEKEFVKLVAENLAISRNGSRAGVITFSWHSEYSIKLKDHDSTQGFQEAVNRLPLFGHTTRIDKALRQARDDLFKSENGGRTNIPKMILLLTDGSQTMDSDAKDPGMIARQIRETGVKIVVIGIGNRINKAELLNIANEASHLYLAKDFEELKSPSFTAKITETTCKKG